MNQKLIRFWVIWRKLKNIFVREHDASDFFITNYKPDPGDFMRKLISLGYQYNYFSYNFKGQICNLRKLVLEHENEIWQYHLRLYDFGKVTGVRR